MAVQTATRYAPSCLPTCLPNWPGPQHEAVETENDAMAEASALNNKDGWGHAGGVPQEHHNMKRRLLKIPTREPFLH